MKFLLLLWLVAFEATPTEWSTDMQSAKVTAEKENKFILLNFSGSDWCGPCIRMHKEIFESEAFEALADGELVLVNADFPRLKKNQLSKTQQKKNDQLAEAYNRQGIFPLTVLLDSKGKVYKSWEGLPNETPQQFANEIKAIVHGAN